MRLIDILDSNRFDFKKKLAFTLAEVLIVVGIIGIIAEITIPTLIKDFQTKVTIVSLKKSFSVFSQAYSMAVQDNGTPENWNLIAAASPAGAANALNTLAPYLKIVNNCGTSKTGCFPYVWYDTLNAQPKARFGDIGSSWATAELPDGSLINVFVRDKDCKYNPGPTLALQNVCADINVDINGFKGPNAMGKDYFGFFITKYGLVPVGMPGDWYNCLTGNGSECTAWVVTNENMDYLTCPGSLSWNGKKTCN